MFKVISRYFLLIFKLMLCSTALICSAAHTFQTSLPTTLKNQIYWFNANQPFTLEIINQSQHKSAPNNIQSLYNVSYILIPAANNVDRYGLKMSPANKHSIIELDVKITTLEMTDYDVQALEDIPVTALQIDSDIFNEKNPTIANNTSISEPLKCTLAYALASHAYQVNDYNDAMLKANKIQNHELTNSPPCLYLLAIKADAAFNLGMYELALSSYQLLIERLNQTSTCNNSHFCTYIQGQLGFSQIVRGADTSNLELMKKGRNNLEQALNQGQLNQFSSLLPDLFNGLATYYWMTNEKQQAIVFLQQAITHTQKVSDSEESTASYSNNLALIYLSIGELLNAQTLLQKSISISRKISDRASLASQLQNYGKLLHRLGDLERSNRYFEEAIDIFDDEKITLGAAYTRMSLMQLYMDKKDYTKAIELYNNVHLTLKDALPELFPLIQAAYALSQSFLGQINTNQLSKVGDQISILLQDKSKIVFGLYLAEAYLNIGEYSSALRWLEQTKSYITAEQVENLKYSQLAITHTLVVTPSPFSDDIHNDIEQQFNAAFKLLTTKAKHLDFKRDGPSWMSQSKDLVNTYTAHLLNQTNYKYHNLAFSILENYFSLMLRKSRQYFHELNRKGNENSSEAKTFEKRKFDAEKALVTVNSKEQKRKALNRLDIADEQKLDARLSNIESPNTSLPNLSIKNVQVALHENEALIRYLELKSNYKAFIITSNDYRLITVPKSSIRAKLQTTSNGHSSQSKILNGQHLPTKWLVSKGINKLYVASDGVINTLSISAATVLVNSNRHAYVAELFDVVRVPSVSDYFSRASETVDNNGMFSIFANPDFSHLGPDQYSAQENNAWRNSLPALPGSKKEAATILNLFPNTNIELNIDSRANTQALMSDTSRASKIWHIATHGYYDPKTPETVGLATTRNNTALNTPTSGFLSLSELLSQPISSHLVVLSGCETLLGQHWNSEGINGLTRGMLAQGAGAVIGTIWEISDRATPVFMQYFYTSLIHTKGNIPKSLTRAKQDLIKSGRYKHPKYWAGFVLTIANRQYEKINLN